jgi:electron transfer flavoprotein beta subunit
VSVVACLKWVSHPGEPHDERFAGMSPADQSALEFALQQGEQLGVGVTVITVGPSGADKVLRDALACGATRAVRVEAPTTTSGTDIATAIADHVAGAQWVWCGDYSLDRGAGSVPPFIAAHLGAEQALGVIHVELGGDVVRATRRLDGGRRELLEVHGPAVVSVEGATARLRRAGLQALRRAAETPIEVVPATTPIHRAEFMVRPYRPRARELPPPAGAAPLDRLRSLTDAAAASAARGEMVTLAPADAAARILQALRDWGYLTERVDAG